jgi:hypothetical protein
MVDEWNHADRQWRYSDVRNMARDYWAAVRQVAFPRFSIGAEREHQRESKTGER